MCGVIAFYSEDPSAGHVDMILRVVEQSKIRGLHSFGFAYPNGHMLAAGKHRTYAEVAYDIAALRKRPPKTLIAHTRYSTSGDWYDNANNQPIMAEGHALVFNGVISQKTRPEYEQEFGRFYTTDNDGEIALRRHIDGFDVENFVARGKFSFAGAFMNPDGETFLLRNANRPLWYARGHNYVIVASTADILRRAEVVAPARPVQVGKLLKLAEL